jgi:hypothetical protein
MLKVGDDAVSIVRDNTLRAGSLTRLAPDATPGMDHYRPSWGLTLRVVAPPTPERTSLEKNRGANARSIVERKPLYVENYSRLQDAVSPALGARRIAANRAYAEKCGNTGLPIIITHRNRATNHRRKT